MRKSKSAAPPAARRPAVNVGSDPSCPGPARRRRWGVVLAVIAVAAVGALAWRLWPRRPDRDPSRLGLLQAALEEFNAGRYDRAEAILDHRAAETATTPLDWMLRARVAEGQGRLQQALDALRHIPDTDLIAPRAWLKAGQIEKARHHLRAAEVAFQHALTLDAAQVQSHRELAF